MRHLLLMTVWTLRERVVRAPSSGALLRMSTFRIRHDVLCSSQLSAPELRADSWFIDSTCPVSLSAPTTVDPQPRPRRSTELHSNSCRSADTTPYNLRGRSSSKATPTVPAHAARLRAATLRLRNTRSQPRRR